MKLERAPRNNEEKVDKALERMYEKVQAVTKEMEERGFKFQISRDSEDFIIKQKDSERELPKGPVADSEIQELKKSGIPFEAREEGESIILSFFRETHVPIWEKIPVGEGSEPVEKVIKAFIMNPGGSVYETINSPEFNEESESGEEVEKI